MNVVENYTNKRKAILNVISQEQELVAAYVIQQEQGTTHRGSITGHVVIHRDREIADRNLFNDYFAENPTYNEAMFRKRFRMSRNLFLRIVEAIKNHDAYFTQRNDGVGRLGLSNIQKTTAALRILAYALPTDATDEYIKIRESTVIECMQRFCRVIIEVFAKRYLRSPTSDDVARLLYVGEQRGFMEMLGSLDCMHWKLKNCPTAWAGLYASRSGSPTIYTQVSTVCTGSGKIAPHAYFGMPGSNNDINVLEASDLFSNLAQGIAPTAHYTIGGKEYAMSYYFADDIYPKWSTIVQSIHDPRGPKINILQ